jgi:phage-related protein
MPLSLSSAIALAKNQLSDDGAWLVLLEIQFNDLAATVLRLVRNTEDIVWGGETWTAYPFDLDEARQSADGSVQSVAIRVSNVLRAVQRYIESLDGMGAAEVIIRVVYSNELDEAAVIEETFSVGKITCAAEWVTIELQPENFWTRRCPRYTYTRQNCRWNFKSDECGYSGATASCNKTLAACAAMTGGSNIARFGGFPAIPGVGFDENGTAESVADA